MPDTHSLAYRCLDRHVIHGRADELAFAGPGRSMTYAQLLHESASIAGAMTSVGVTAGTIVALDLPSARERLIAVLACVRLNAEIDAAGGVAVAGDPPVLTTTDTQVPWDVLVRAGRTDPAPAPPADTDGYEDRVAAQFPDLVATLLAGDALT